MLQAGDGPGLALNPGAEIRVRTEVCGKDFDSDGAVQPRVARLVDLPHAARAQGRLDFVGTELCARGQGHFFSSASQFKTKVSGAGLSLTELVKRNRPSRVTSYPLPAEEERMPV